jgi:hypothetical protein
MSAPTQNAARRAGQHDDRTSRRCSSSSRCAGARLRSRGRSR